MMKVGDRTFSFVRGSDVQRDGMYLEVTERTGSKDRIIAEVFYSDESGQMTFSAFEKDLPFEVVETVARIARESLMPTTVTGEAV